MAQELLCMGNVPDLAAVCTLLGRSYEDVLAYARATRPLLAWHLRHTALASRLCRSGRVLDAGLRASATHGVPLAVPK